MNDQKELYKLQQDVMAAQAKRAPSGIMELSNALREEYFQAKSEGRLVQWKAKRKQINKPPTLAVEAIKEELAILEHRMTLLESDFLIYQLQQR